MHDWIFELTDYEDPKKEIYREVWDYKIKDPELIINDFIKRMRDYLEIY